MGTAPSNENAPAKPDKKIVERGPDLHLDIIEELFGDAWKRWGPGRRALERAAGGQFEGAAVLFREHEVALSAVASTFAGRRLSLRAAEAAGGILEGVLLLPRLVALGPDRRANRDVLFVRAAIAGAMVASFAKSPVDEDAQKETERLALAVATATELARQYGGFCTRVSCAAAYEFCFRPDPSDLPPFEQPLECLRRAALAELARLGTEGELHAVNAGETLRTRLATTPRFQDALATFLRTDPDVYAPPVRSFFHQLMRSKAAPLQSPGPLILLGGVLTPTDRDQAGAALSESESSKNQDAEEREAPARDHVRETVVEEDPYKENMPSHSFEKIDFADNFDGGFRRLDGADDMDDQGESLDGVDLREMIRGGPEVATIYNAEIGDVGEIPDVMTTQPGERGVTYDEWDQGRGSYRRDWVTLYPTQIDARYPEFGKALKSELSGTIRRAIRALDKSRTERIARNRQLDGDEIDLDGVIEEYAERRRGGSPPGRHYVHSPRLERDVATCVMLDLSFSADSWVENKRVLDVELAAACVLGEVAEAIEDNLSIMAFASNTRNLCRTWTVKDWDDSWTVGRARLGALTPQGYTRIGPAIRHGTAALAKHPARKKHLIVITDGKPTDFDRYEGGHGIHDVAWAVREARRCNVTVHALGIDPREAATLPTMFGPSGWRVLRHISELPDALVKAYG